MDNAALDVVLFSSFHSLGKTTCIINIDRRQKQWSIPTDGVALFEKQHSNSKVLQKVNTSLFPASVAEVLKV